MRRADDASVSRWSSTLLQRLNEATHIHALMLDTHTHWMSTSSRYTIANHSLFAMCSQNRKPIKLVFIVWFKATIHLMLSNLLSDCGHVHCVHATYITCTYIACTHITYQLLPEVRRAVRARARSRSKYCWNYMASVENGVILISAVQYLYVRARFQLMCLICSPYAVISLTYYVKYFSALYVTELNHDTTVVTRHHVTKHQVLSLSGLHHARSTRSSIQLSIYIAPWMTNHCKVAATVVAAAGNIHSCRE